MGSQMWEYALILPITHYFWNTFTVNLAEKYRAAHLKNNPDYPQVSADVYYTTLCL